MYTIVGYKGSACLPLERFSFLLTPFIQSGEFSLLKEEENRTYVRQIVELSKGKPEWRLILIDGTAIYDEPNPYEKGARTYWLPVVRGVRRRGENIFDTAQTWCPPRNIYLLCFNKEGDPCLLGQRKARGAFARGYPSHCRFLVYTLREKENFMKEQELLKALCGALVLSLNEIPHYALEAYQLYSLGIDFNYDRFADSLKQWYRRCQILREKCGLEENELDQEYHKYIKADPPSFRLDPPETFLPLESLKVDPKKYANYGRKAEKDRRQWYDDRLSMDDMLKRLMQFPADYLQLQVNKMKIRVAECRIEGSFCSLNQLAEYEANQKKLELELINLGIGPSFDMEEFLEEKEEEEREITNLIESRLERKEDKKAGYRLSGLMAALSVAPSLLGFVYLFVADKKSAGVQLLCVALLFVLNAVLVWGYFSATQYRVRRALRDYNKLLKRLSDHISDSLKRYERFLEKWGQYYFILKVLEHHRESGQYLEDRKLCLKRHERAIGQREKMIEAIMGETPSVRKATMKELAELAVDFSVEPEENLAYEIAVDGLDSLELEGTGIQLRSPFPFLHRISLTKEVLYGG